MDVGHGGRRGRHVVAGDLADVVADAVVRRVGVAGGGGGGGGAVVHGGGGGGGGGGAVVQVRRRGRRGRRHRHRVVRVRAQSRTVRRVRVVHGTGHVHAAVVRR